MRTLEPSLSTQKSSCSLSTALRVHTEACDEYEGFQDSYMESRIKEHPDSVVQGLKLLSLTDPLLFEKTAGSTCVVKIPNSDSVSPCWVFAKRTYPGHYTLYPYCRIRTKVFTSQEPGKPVGVLASKLSKLITEVSSENLITLGLSD